MEWIEDPALLDLMVGDTLARLKLRARGSGPAGFDGGGYAVCSITPGALDPALLDFAVGDTAKVRTFVPEPGSGPAGFCGGGYKTASQSMRSFAGSGPAGFCGGGYDLARFVIRPGRRILPC